MYKIASRLRRIAIELIDDAAASVDKLADHVKGITQKVVWQSPPYKGGRKFLSLIASTDKDGSPFYHVQRTGKDSVAFCCFSTERPNELLCLNQWSSPYKQMVKGAFTGSLDKDIEREEIVIEEAYEEAGITVNRARLHFVGSEMVGGSSDEIVHLYLIDVTGHIIGEKNPENIYEELAQRLWLTLDEIKTQCEWKAKLIAARYSNAMGSDGAPAVMRTPLVNILQEQDDLSDDIDTDQLVDFEVS